jgi:YHS domain-containing protein
VLDSIALVVFALIYWLYRNQERLGGGAGYAQDPVCGMQVETATAASLEHDGHLLFFCSERCRDRFVKDLRPERADKGALGTIAVAETQGD